MGTGGRRRGGRGERCARVSVCDVGVVGLPVYYKHCFLVWVLLSRWVGGGCGF